MTDIMLIGEPVILVEQAPDQPICVEPCEENTLLCELERQDDYVIVETTSVIEVIGIDNVIVETTSVIEVIGIDNVVVAGTKWTQTSKRVLVCITCSK